jgi:hypothetical protein
MNNVFDPKRLSVLPSGYFGTSSDLIFTVEDLITEYEANKLLHLAKNARIWSQSPYKNVYSDPMKIKQQNLDCYNLLEEIRERWKEHVSKFYNVEITTYQNPICSWPVGNSQKPHADKEWEDGSPGEQNYYDIGSVIYLNDDYEGGEIYWPQHDIKIKPKARSATAFPGDLFFLHGVNTIQKIERYSIPIFWTVPKYEKEKDRSLDE